MATDRYSKMTERELNAEIKDRDIDVPERIVFMKNDSNRREKLRESLRRDDESRVSKKGFPIVATILLILFIVLAVTTVTVAAVILRDRPVVADVPTLPNVLATQALMAQATYTLLPPQPTYTPLATPNTVLSEPTTILSTTNVTTEVTTGGSEASTLQTFKFDYPNATIANGEGWSVNGLPANPDPATVLVALCPDSYGNCFQNKIGLGSQSWLAEPGTILVGPEFPQATIDSAGGAIERINPINQKLIDHAGEMFHLNEDRIDFCSFGSAELEFNGVVVNLEYIEGHNWFLIIRGLFPDIQQDSDRNHTILFHDVVGSHAQCMSYPGNGGGFMSEGNFDQVVALSHQNAGNCGAEGCSGLDVLFIDMNTGAFTIIHQDNLNQPWKLVSSNWFNQ